MYPTSIFIEYNICMFFCKLFVLLFIKKDILLLPIIYPLQTAANEVVGEIYSSDEKPLFWLSDLNQ